MSEYGDAGITNRVLTRKDVLRPSAETLQASSVTLKLVPLQGKGFDIIDVNLH